MGALPEVSGRLTWTACGTTGGRTLFFTNAYPALCPLAFAAKLFKSLFCPARVLPLIPEYPQLAAPVFRHPGRGAGEWPKGPGTIHAFSASWQRAKSLALLQPGKLCRISCTVSRAEARR